MADTEEYFPRGGKKPNVQYFKQSSNFLGAAEKGERKKKKPKKKSEDDDGYLSDEAVKETQQSYINCAVGLSYKTTKPGVLILGRVRSVLETKVNVMLPCKMTGVVMACHISEAYNKLLEAYVNDQIDQVKELPEMFRPGQYVSVKVLETNTDNLMLSMMPQHVNGGKNHSQLHKGSLLQAAVSSVEDHGYVMDIGIANTRAFLAKENVNPEIELDTGMVTWVCVKSVSPSPHSSVVVLSSKLEDLQSAVQRKPGSPLLPGSAVEFVVDNPLENGIEGHIFADTTAYIQRQHADKVKGKKPALGQKIRGRVLYVMPTRNTPFLSMRNIFETTHPDLTEEQKHAVGDVVEDAQVIRITGRSIHFKLGRGSMGTMSLKRIQVDEDLADEEVVAHSYPVGSTHKVRILCYHLSDFSYTVSDQPGVVSEQYFSLQQLAVGQAVTGTVSAVGERVTVSVGRLTGYVPQSHLSDAGTVVDPKKASVSKLPKKKFKVGQEVKARVLVVEPEKRNLILTLKPSLLAADVEALSSYQQAEIGKAYTGVIKFIRDYVLVAFFNNVQAFVPRNYVTKDLGVNLTDAFHLGQIVNCTILKVEPEAKKMCGSLTTAPFWPRPKNEKRHQTEDTDEVPKKKQKNNEDSNETTSKKKDKKKKQDVTEPEETENKKERKRKKDKKPHENTETEQSDNDSARETETANTKAHKRKRDKHNDEKASEESDAIETDLHDENDVLTAEDLGLVDLTDCVTSKHYKHKIVKLLKSINIKTAAIDKIEEKIQNIEEKGLHAKKNKKYHTAMHMEKIVIEERVKKYLEALKTAQEKLAEFGEEKTEFQKKKDLKKEKVSESETKESVIGTQVEKKETQKTNKDKKVKKDVKVVESLEPALEVPSAKEFWSTSDDTAKNVKEDESSSSDDEEKDQPKKKRKKLTVAEKLAKVREEEERVREMERRAIESESQPRSTEQFERALLASPDSSQLWIAYMAFHLQATEIEKARGVCRKALSTISFREEAERANVWLALLNCEHRFGTKETQQKTLEEATQMNEPYKIHSKLLDILVETGKPQELSSLVDLMLRKYRREAQSYILCGGACFKLGLVDKARQVMQKAVAVLEKKEHVSVLVQFALLERASGAPERAEALFEQVLAVYPQRVDVAAVYADMLLKAGDTDRLRQVMERMTSQKLPARKMKVLYKKWIEVEERLGNQEQVENIRQRAMEYIDKAKF